MMREWPGMRRVLLRLAIWPMIFLATCSPLPAEQAGAISPEPSMLRLSEAEIVSMFEPEEPYSALELAYVMLELQVEARAEIKATAELTAADTARPLLVELAGVTAERNVYAKQARLGKWIGAAGFGFGVVCIVIPWLHFFLPQTMALPP